MRVTRRMMWDLWMRGACAHTPFAASALQIYVCVVGFGCVSERILWFGGARGWSDEARSGQPKTAPALWKIGTINHVD